MAESRPHLGAVIGIGLFVAALVLAAIETGTVDRQTPPGPDVAAGTLDGAGYVLHRWAGGRSFFLWHDQPSAVNGYGSGSTADGIYTYAGHAGEVDGSGFSWEARTADGQTVELFIGDLAFSLAHDAIFFVTSGPAGLQVCQLARDLGAFAANSQGAAAVLADEPAVAAFANHVVDSASALITDALSLAQALPSQSQCAQVAR